MSGLEDLTKGLLSLDLNTSTTSANNSPAPAPAPAGGARQKVKPSPQRPPEMKMEEGDGVQPDTLTSGNTDGENQAASMQGDTRGTAVAQVGCVWVGHMSETVVGTDTQGSFPVQEKYQVKYISCWQNCQKQKRVLVVASHTHSQPNRKCFYNKAHLQLELISMCAFI